MFETSDEESLRTVRLHLHLATEFTVHSEPCAVAGVAGIINWEGSVTINNDNPAWNANIK